MSEPNYNKAFDQCRSKKQRRGLSMRRQYAEDMATYYRGYLSVDSAGELDGSDASHACRAYEEVVELHRELGTLRRLYDAVNRLRLMVELDSSNEDRGQLIDAAVVDAIETMKEADR